MSVQYNDRLSYTVYQLQGNQSLRVWYDKDDNTYCYQLLIYDKETDDFTIYELSDGYISIEDICK